MGYVSNKDTRTKSDIKSIRRKERVKESIIELPIAFSRWKSKQLDTDEERDQKKKEFCLPIILNDTSFTFIIIMSLFGLILIEMDIAKYVNRLLAIQL